MEKSTEQTLKALLTQSGLEPKEGDLERFGKLIDTYMAALQALHSVDLADEEFAPTFHPERKTE
ncbi:MAG: hypothetical protein O7B35_02070 [Deltaproteobacteria bacterium]|nr:hypothetical protein [Deltaproteobacteria bacterium]